MVIDAHLSTAARAYQESAIRRAGARGAAVQGLISLAAGYPAPDTFPWDDLQAITHDLLARHDANTLQYGSTRGYRPLVEHIVGRLLAPRGIKASASHVVVTTGSQQGLDLAGRVLIDPGDVVLVELPTYSGAIAAFHNLQAELVGVPMDTDGMELGALDRIVEGLRADGRRPRFLYLTPNFQNPSGLLMGARRRGDLLAAAARHDLLILEDDPYGSLYFEDTTRAEDTRPLKADDEEGRVIYLGTMSKTLVPGFRVAWMVAHDAVAHKVELAKQAADLCSGVFDQRVVHAAIDRGVVDRLAPVLRSHYQQKRTAMEQALTRELGDRVRWTQPRGGFFLWVELPEGVDDRALFERALAERVSFVIGSAFHVDGEGHRRARLSFSGITLAQIDDGIARLARAVGSLL